MIAGRRADVEYSSSTRADVPIDDAGADRDIVRDTGIDQDAGIDREIGGDDGMDSTSIRDRDAMDSNKLSMEMVDAATEPHTGESKDTTVTEDENDFPAVNNEAREGEGVSEISCEHPVEGRESEGDTGMQTDSNQKEGQEGNDAVGMDRGETPQGISVGVGGNLEGAGENMERVGENMEGENSKGDERELKYSDVLKNSESAGRTRTSESDGKNGNASGGQGARERNQGGGGGREGGGRRGGWGPGRAHRDRRGSGGG